MKWIFTLTIIVAGLFAKGQQVFSFDEFLSAVRSTHPVARQSAIVTKLAAAELKKSRGAFDPVIMYDNQQKQYDGTSYYDRSDVSLKVPVWFGMDVSAGREIAEGDRLNREETRGALNYFGVAMDPLRMFVMDERRAALQQAKIFRDRSFAEQRAMLNDLFFDASKAYVEWWESHRQLDIIRRALRNAEQRLMMVRTMYLAGERPAIDTLEAFTQVQLIKQYENEAWTSNLKNRIGLSVYLWSEGGEIISLPEDVNPGEMTMETPPLDTVISAIDNHPHLIMAEHEIRALKVEKRFRAADVLPNINLKYNQLAKETSKIFNGNWLQNNNRFGISVVFPLRISEAVGNLQTAKWKLAAQELDRDKKQAEINTRVKQDFLEWQQLKFQIEQQQSLLRSFEALEKGEDVRFANGESSLFLVNARQMKVIESQQKLVELQASGLHAQLKLRWSAGILAQG